MSYFKKGHVIIKYLLMNNKNNNNNNTIMAHLKDVSQAVF